VGRRSRAAGIVVIAVFAMCWGLPLCRAQVADNKAEVNSGTAASSGVVVPAEVAGEYLIGPDDVLAVNVWKESELSEELPVRPDGKISLPLIGDVQASSLIRWMKSGPACWGGAAKASLTLWPFIIVPPVARAPGAT
jgi:hypothetical protein